MTTTGHGQRRPRILIGASLMQVTAQGRGSAELEVLCRPRNRRAIFVANLRGQGDFPRLFARLDYEGRRHTGEFA